MDALKMGTGSGTGSMLKAASSPENLLGIVPVPFFDGTLGQGKWDRHLIAAVGIPRILATTWR
jgi:hypothetical protein